VAKWGEFTAAAPELAAFGLRFFDRYKVALLATAAADGGPRVAPVTPIITHASLYVFVNPKTPKYADLVCDGRCVIHALMDLGRDDEFQIAARARRITDSAIRADVAASAGFPVLEQDRDSQLFEFDVARAFSTIWYHQGQPDTRPIRARWRAP
jgi:hypothetical protein